MIKKITLSQKILFFIILIAFTVRIISLTIFMYKHDISINEKVTEGYPFLVADAGTYYFTAINLMEGKGYSIPVTDGNYKETSPPPGQKPSNIKNNYYHNIYPPVYPLFLSILFYFFGTSILAYAIPQIILGTICCYLTYVIAKETFSPKVGLLASFLLAVYPPIAWWTSYIRNENLFIPLQLFTIIFLMKAVKNNLNQKNIILSGIFLAVTSLCRNVVIYLPVFIICIFFIIFRWKIKRFIFSSAIFLTTFIIVLLPWAYRNYTVFNKFTFTTVEGWSTFNICNSVSSADTPFFGLFEIKDHDENEEALLLSKGAKKASIDFVKKCPLKYLKLCLKRFLTFWGPITKKPCFLKKITDTFIYIIVFPMAFLGFYKSKWWLNTRKDLKPVSILLITIILYYTILHSLVGLDEALIYRYPIIPLICIFSAYGFYNYFKPCIPETSASNLTINGKTKQ